MDRELFEAAQAVRQRAHAPYSDFPVGAALRTAAGTIHVGCNVENAAFPEGWCAETTAIGRMVAADRARRRPADRRGLRRRRADRRPARPRPAAAAGSGSPSSARPTRWSTATTPTGNGRTWRLGELLPAVFALNGRADERRRGAAAAAIDPRDAATCPIRSAWSSAPGSAASPTRSTDAVRIPYRRAARLSRPPASPPTAARWSPAGSRACRSSSSPAAPITTRRGDAGGDAGADRDARRRSAATR